MGEIIPFPNKKRKKRGLEVTGIWLDEALLTPPIPPEIVKKGLDDHRSDAWAYFFAGLRKEDGDNEPE